MTPRALLGSGSLALDEVLGGGLNPGSLLVVAGAPGTGKTILAQQIAFTNATPDHGAVYYTTWSEPHDKLVEHLDGFRFFEAQLLGGTVQFVHAGDVVSGDDGLGAFADEVLRTAFDDRPSVIVLDSSKALHAVTDGDDFRRRLYELASRVALAGTTLILVGEYTERDLDECPEFAVADTIAQLVNAAVGPVDRRLLRVLKRRGARQLPGQHSFAITPDGFTVYPRLETLLEDAPSPGTDGRLPIGVPGLDEIMGGGVPAGDATLVLGPSGVGKTMLSLAFLARGVEEGELGLMLSFQETEEQLIRKAAAFGHDLADAVASGRLHLRYIPPVELDLDRIGAIVREEMTAAGARRVVVDSVAELAFAARDTVRLPGYIWALAGFIRSLEATAIFTNATALLGPGGVENGTELSMLFSNIVMLRYIERDGRSARAVSVTKMRESAHSPALHAVEVGDDGMTVGGELTDVRGMLGWSALQS